MSLKLAADTALRVLPSANSKRKEQLKYQLGAVQTASQTPHPHTFGGSKRSGRLLSTYITGRGLTCMISNLFNNPAGPELFLQRRNLRFRDGK